MNNTQSSPQILVPNVPVGFCPTGNWQQIFQQFVDLVLKNATLSIPGIGDVTAEQIQEINSTLTSLQNQINANVLYYRSGEVTLDSATDKSYIVAFTEPMPNNLYGISLSFGYNGTPAGTPEPVAAVINGEIYTTGFGLRVENGIVGWTVKWFVIGQAA